MVESEEAVRARARSAEAAPSASEVEERNLGRSWRPHCAKGRAASYGLRRVQGDEQGVPAASVDCVRARGASRGRRRRGVATVAMKDGRTKAIVANAAQGEGVVVLGQLGYRKWR